MLNFFFHHKLRRLEGLSSVSFRGLEVVLIHCGVDVALVGQELDGILHLGLGQAALQLRSQEQTLE